MRGIATVIAALAGLTLAPPCFADTPPAAPVSSPVGIGAPHLCQNYPDRALEDREQGTTLDSFKIGTDGVPRAITVVVTSGSPDLDQAAVDCVKAWRYSPAKKGGLAIAVPWKAQVVWKAPPFPSPVGFDPAAHSCSEVAAAPNPPQRFARTEISFWVEANGSVSGALVARPSGDAKLDQALLACVSHWTYSPASKGGKAIRIYWGATFKWAPETGLSAFEPFGRGHVCGKGYYPQVELRERVEGDVVLRFTIGTDGALDHIAVGESSGNQALDIAAIACVQRWQYLPALQSGVPISVPWSALISFKDGGAVVAELGDAN
jgi:protein TonB